MEEKITLDMLTQDSVSVKKQNYTTINNVEYPIGEPWRKSYINSINGREEIKKDLDEKYINSILSVWGDKATVVENTTE